MINYHNINLRFENKTIFNDFNLSIKKGEVILLKAESGKGKTTLIKMLLGFIRPDSGLIKIGDNVLSKSTISLFRNQIAYVSQDVELGNKVVKELINDVFSYKINSKKIVSRERIMELFDYFELEHDSYFKDISKLSGGQRQRLGLIICILLDRPIWILDEVTSGLDRHLKKKVVEYITSTDQTVIVISHDEIWLDHKDVRIKEF